MTTSVAASVGVESDDDANGVAVGAGVRVGEGRGRVGDGVKGVTSAAGVEVAFASGARSVATAPPPNHSRAAMAHAKQTINAAKSTANAIAKQREVFILLHFF